jgi:hypothetical protein
VKNSIKATGLVAAVLMPLLCAPGWAQTNMLGARAGTGMAVAFFEDEFSNDRIDPLLGLQFGVIASHRLTRTVALRAEALYTRKGWTEFVTGGGRRLTYLEFPLMLEIRVPWKVSPHLLVGPSASLEIGCAITGVPEVGSVSCDDPQVEWDRAKLLVGGVVGIGVSPPLGRGVLHLELLANIGLTDANRERLPVGYMKFAAAILSLGYTVPIGGS